MKKLLKLSHPTLEKIFTGLGLEHGFHSAELVTTKSPLHQKAPLIHKSPLILFAFRGAMPIQKLKGWTKEIILELIKPDYIHMRCTIGIWDRDHKRIFAALGSTVPYKVNVEKAAARIGKLKGKGTNQLEPGFYTDLSKGEHLQGKLNGHQGLRQTANRFYRRSLTGIPYTDSAPLFFGNPYDNLHCGWNLDGKAEGFSSSGCMVIAGIPHCHRHEKPFENQGEWKIFHDLIYQTEQTQFSILLLPAEKAAKIGVKNQSNEFVYGSSGEAVKALQKQLIALGQYRGRAHGIIDARTYKAFKKAF